MRSKRLPISDVIDHPLFCHLAPSAAVVASIEASARRDGRTARGEDEENATPPAGPAAGGCFAAPWAASWAVLRAAFRLPLPRVDSATAYAVLLRKAVTIVTLAWPRRARGPRLDPAVGALRNTGLFLRPHAVRARDDATEAPAGLVPAPTFVANPSPKQ
jgi:hypothetical protein